MPAPADLAYNLIHRFNVGDALLRSAKRDPQRRAIHYQGHDLSYAELDALTNRVARLLMARGIGPGDAVAIFATNSPEFVATFFGCARIGAVLVPINLMFTPEDVSYVLETTRVKALLVESVFLPKVDRSPAVCFVMDGQFRAELAAQDGSTVEQVVDHESPVLIVFTSGTTAKPKGVTLTHLNLYAYLLTAYAEFGLDRSRRHLLALPLFHIAGLDTAFACYASGCDSVIIPLPKLDPILQAITELKINTVALPATLWVGPLQTRGIDSADLSSLTHPFVFQYLPTPVFQRWRQLASNAQWVNCWGQTETTALGSSTPPAELGGMLSAPD